MTLNQPQEILFQPARFGPGWGNPRITTAMHISRTQDTLRLQTLLPGLQPGSLTVTLNTPHVIIEGLLVASEARGRYIRHVPELPEGTDHTFTVTYESECQLIIEVTLKGES